MNEWEKITAISEIEWMILWEGFFFLIDYLRDYCYSIFFKKTTYINQLVFSVSSKILHGLKSDSKTSFPKLNYFNKNLNFQQNEVTFANVFTVVCFKNNYCRRKDKRLFK